MATREHSRNQIHVILGPDCAVTRLARVVLRLYGFRFSSLPDSAINAPVKVGDVPIDFAEVKTVLFLKCHPASGWMNVFGITPIELNGYGLDENGEPYSSLLEFVDAMLDVSPVMRRCVELVEAFDQGGEMMMRAIAASDSEIDYVRWLSNSSQLSAENLSSALFLRPR